jgi:hypothetical protein
MSSEDRKFRENVTLVIEYVFVAEILDPSPCNPVD